MEIAYAGASFANSDLADLAEIAYGNRMLKSFYDGGSKGFSNSIFQMTCCFKTRVRIVKKNCNVIIYVLNLAARLSGRLAKYLRKTHKTK